MAQQPEPIYLLQGLNSCNQWKTLTIYTTKNEALAALDSIRANEPIKHFQVQMRSFTSNATYSDKVIK